MRSTHIGNLTKKLGTFHKLDHFSELVKLYTLMKWSSLQKVSIYTPNILSLTLGENVIRLFLAVIYECY
jgi:hypothetical protein